jgi:uncharacterized protein YdiU (UPF0061 family)
MYKTLKQKLNENDNLFTTLNTIIKAKQQKDNHNNQINNEKNKQQLNRKITNEEIDCKKIIKNWQDNWSFVEKKQENNNDHSVILTIPEPNELISPITCHE